MIWIVLGFQFLCAGISIHYCNKRKLSPALFWWFLTMVFMFGVISLDVGGVS